MATTYKRIQTTSPSGHRIDLVIPMQGKGANAERVGGIHAGDKSKVQNTCKPRVQANKRQVRAEKRLAARISDWEDTQKSARHDHHRPGSLKVR